MNQLLLLWLLLLPVGLRAQPAQPAEPVPTQPHRAELYLSATYSDVRVLPMADSTVALFIETTPPTSFREVYSFRHLNKALQPLRETQLEVPRDYHFLQAAAEAPFAYALFQSNYVPAKLHLLRLDLRDGHMQGYSFDTKVIDEVFDLEVLDRNLFATVEVDNHFTVLHIDVNREDFRLLPAVYEPVPTQLTFLADSSTKRAGFVLSQTNGYLSRLQIKQLSAQGQLLATQFVQSESGRGLITAELSPGDSTSRLLAGTYTLRDPRYSQGLFASDLSGGPAVRPTMRFYDFTHLKHFFDFMRPRRAERLRARSAQRRAAGRELRLHYRILTHRMVPFQDGYVLVAEAYYPRYRHDSPGLTLFASGRSFDGYRSSHAIVCGFDRNGSLLWDNTFVLKDAQRFTLTETVRLRPLPDGKRLALAYLEENRIRYKIVDRTATSSNDLHVPVSTNTAGQKEKTVSTTQQGLLTWYGSRFLAYGFQRVRPEHGSSREVFFLNAVAFD